MDKLSSQQWHMRGKRRQLAAVFLVWGVAVAGTPTNRLSKVLISQLVLAQVKWRGAHAAMLQFE
jgi:hypothetical protein